jgi:hypothetical protein
MAAVLQGAVDDVRGSPHRRVADGVVPDSQVARAAVAYLVSRDREWPFSFENLCEALSLEPRRLRHALRNATGPGAAGNVAGPDDERGTRAGPPSPDAPGVTTIRRRY